VADRLSFDVLVIGSGASGLAAAVSAERAGARVALATKDALQSCNSAKAQGGIQASFGEDDSPEIHAEDVWKSSHETADRRLVEVLTGEAQGAIHWLEELGVQFTREITPRAPGAARGGTASPRSGQTNGGYRLARCGGSSRKRLLQVGDRTGHAITTALRESWQAGGGTSLPKSPLSSLEPAENGWHARCGEHELDAGAVVLAAGGRCFREAEERGELSTNHPGATGEVTKLALALGAEARDLDALQYHPNGGAWPPNMQGYSIPETTRAYGAVLLNKDGEEFTDSLGPRDAVSQAIFDEVEKGNGVETPDGRPAVLLDTTRIPQADAEVSLPYMLRRYRAAGIDPLTEPIYTYPVLHYQNGGLVIDTDGETTLEGLYACGEIAGGTHGRNRMMGNSLLECCVFGRRAGKAAAERSMSMSRRLDRGSPGAELPALPAPERE
jgi:L-aspartate oxidase